MRRSRPALCSALAALLVFIGALRAAYFVDDFAILREDKRAMNVSRWKRYFTESYNGGLDNLYRPLASLSMAIEVKLHGNGDDAAWKFHVTNWLLHAAVAALVATLARRLVAAGDDDAGAKARANAVGLVAGLMYAVHTVHTEVVAAVTGRPELLSALGFLGALVLMFKPLTTRRAFAIFGCFAVSVLSKEHGLLLPLVLMVLVGLYWPRQLRPAAIRRSPPAELLVLLVTFSLSAYIVFRESRLKFFWDRHFLDWAINPLIQAKGVDQIGLPLTILGRYVGLLVWPAKLSIDYGYTMIRPQTDWHEIWPWIGMAAIAVWLIAAAWAWRKRDRVTLFCLIAFAISYSLISNFVVLIGTAMGERLIYLPSAFFCIAAARGFVRVAERPRENTATHRLRPAAVAVMSIVLVALAVRTAWDLRLWSDRDRLYRQRAADNPRSVFSVRLVMVDLMLRGRLDEAEVYAQMSRELAPDYFGTWLTSTRLNIARGRFDDAQRDLVRMQKCLLKADLAAVMGDELQTDLFRARAAATQPGATR